MNQNEWLSKVEKVAEDVCQREGCFLYDLDFLGTGLGRTLRVWIDKDTGAGIEDCSNVSKGLNLMLDVEDIVPGGPYHLEVSTPGIDRNLKKRWHFEKAIGKKVWVKSIENFETLGAEIERYKKAKQLEAVLTKIDGEIGSEALVFETKEGELRLPLSHIEKAKIIFEMNTKNKKRG